MDTTSKRWANQQIIWGWAFLIAIVLVLVTLVVAFWWPPIPMPSDAGTDMTLTPTRPAAEVEAALVDAKATLAAASVAPVTSMADVRAAAATVVAATSQAPGTGSETADPPAPTTAPPDGMEPATGIGWSEWVLGVIPALTAIVTFVGLVTSSIMKWRSDLRTTTYTKADVEYEKEKLHFELQKQRFELERIRQSMELDQQRLEIERERLALERLQQQSAAADWRGSPAATAPASVTQEDEPDSLADL